MSKDKKKYFNILKGAMESQVGLIEEYYTSSDILGLDILSLRNDLYSILEPVISNLNSIIVSCFLSSKRKFLDSINRDMVLRGSDEMDKKLLEDYNTLNVIRLTGDVHDKLFENILSEKSDIFKDFIENEKLRGNQTTLSRINLITNDVIRRSSTTGQLQGMRDFGYTKVFVRPHTGGDVCDLCMDEYLRNPHFLDTIEKKYPMHPNCECTLRKVFLEEPSDDPVEQERYVNLVHYYSENS